MLIEPSVSWSTSTIGTRPASPTELFPAGWSGIVQGYNDDCGVDSLQGLCVLANRLQVLTSVGPGVTVLAGQRTNWRSDASFISVSNYFGDKLLKLSDAEFFAIEGSWDLVESVLSDEDNVVMRVWGKLLGSVRWFSGETCRVKSK